jgi:hypothetical protein
VERKNANTFARLLRVEVFIIGEANIDKHSPLLLLQSRSQNIHRERTTKNIHYGINDGPFNSLYEAIQQHKRSPKASNSKSAFWVTLNLALPTGSEPLL